MAPSLRSDLVTPACLVFLSVSMIALTARWDEPEPSPAQQARRAVGRLHLADAMAGATAALPVSIRLLVTETSIDVDSTDFFSRSSSFQRQRFLSIPEEERLGFPFFFKDVLTEKPEGTPGVFDEQLRPLVDILKATKALEDRLDALAADPQAAYPDSYAQGPAVCIWADRSAPFRLVAQAMVSAARTGHSLCLVFQHDAGPRSLLLPSFHARIYTPTPVVTLEETGFGVRMAGEMLYSKTDVAWLKAAREFAVPQGKRRGAPEPPPESQPPLDAVKTQRAPLPLRGAMILHNDRGCPSVPRREGKLDRERGTALLASIARALPGCDELLLQVPEKTRWAEVVEILAMGAEAGFSAFSFRFPLASPKTDAVLYSLWLPEDIDAPHDCANAFTPDQISPDDVRNLRD